MPLGWRLLRIQGRSMAPALDDGDYAVARRVRPDEPVPVGTIVELDHPDFGRMVKRVSEHRAGKLRLRGDSPSSLEPGQIGPVDPALIRARLVWRIAPRGLSRL